MCICQAKSEQGTAPAQTYAALIIPGWCLDLVAAASQPVSASKQLGLPRGQLCTSESHKPAVPRAGAELELSHS